MYFKVASIYILTVAEDRDAQANAIVTHKNLPTWQYDKAFVPKLASFQTEMQVLDSSTYDKAYLKVAT